MRLLLIRHGMTAGNARRRYIGATDEPLSPEGIRQAEAMGSRSCPAVFVTPLRRTQETAALLFPQAEQRVVAALREMDFGIFENRSADEMAEDADYRAWVDSFCLAPCPGGESKAAFCSRVCAAFAETVAELQAQGFEEGVFVLHGGSIMAILERFGRPQRGYYDYSLKNCQGYRCTLSPGGEGLPFLLTEVTLKTSL